MKKAVLILGSLLFVNSAFAGNLALTCLGTKTTYTIKFQYRWGESDSWKTSSVDPGKWRPMTHMYAYSGENSSPQLQVRYDDNLTSSSHYVVTDLDSYAADTKRCVDGGKLYKFWSQNSELFIEDQN